MKILLAVDGSECSLKAVEEIARRPWPTGCSIEVLTVVDLPFLPTAEAWAVPDTYYAQAEQAGKEQAQTTVNQAVKQIRERHGATLEIIPKITVGHTVSEILDEAQSWGADLIVLGSHGYRGMKRFLLGSVSNAVASHANCSVEIVRSPQASQA